MTGIVFKKYRYDGGLIEITDEDKNGDEIHCDFCGASFFILVDRAGKTFLECRCGNKMGEEQLQNTVKHCEIEKYQNLLESFEEIKDEFLFKIRTDNRNTDNERVGIFVDIQNLYYGAKENFSSKIDFKTLRDNVLRGRQLVSANAYLIDSSSNNNKSFISCLMQLGYTLRIKELKVRGNGSAKGNSDIEMAMDAINQKDKIDTAALVTGDGDFVPLVEFLKSKGIRVEVYSFSVNKNSTAFDLKQIADEFYEIDESYVYAEKQHVTA